MGTPNDKAGKPSLDASYDPFGFSNLSEEERRRRTGELGPNDAEVASWLAPEPPAARQAPAPAALTHADIFGGLPPEDGAALQRQLRMERARRSYEQRFGMPAMTPDGRQYSLYAQNRQGDVDALLARLRLAQQQGWRR
jgi:hypothetical protein